MKTSQIVRTIKKLQRRLVQKNILVLGDSHVKVFEHWRFLLRLPQIYFNVISVQGATASGLDNPNSKTQAYKVFTEALDHKNKKWGTVIICLGEVDTGFIIWYRAQKYNQPVGKIFTQTIEKYISFLSAVASQVEHLIVISAPLPTIKDGTQWGEVANLRKEVKVSQQERTQLALQFNAKINLFCSVHNIDYLNLDSDSLDKNGLVKDLLYSKNRHDHHYNQDVYAIILIEQIKRLF